MKKKRIPKTKAEADAILDENLKDLSGFELYNAFKKTKGNTKKDEIILEILRRLTVLESKSE